MVPFSWEILNWDGSLGGTACMEEGSSMGWGCGFRLENLADSGFLLEHWF